MMVKSKPPKTLGEMVRDTEAIEAGGKGFVCPRCGCRDTRVQTTRTGDNMVLRYRVCRNCKHHRATLES